MSDVLAERAAAEVRRLRDRVAELEAADELYRMMLDAWMAWHMGTKLMREAA